MLALTVPVDVSQDDLRSAICDLFPLVAESREGAVVEIEGRSSDMDELMQDASVRAFAQKCIDTGFISVLDVSTKDAAFSRYEGVDELGAYELWRLATGEVSHDRFIAALRVSNRVAECVLEMSHHYDRGRKFELRRIR